MISAGDLLKLYSAVQSAADAEAKRERANELDDAIKRNIFELFEDPAYPKRRRSFGVIQKAFGGYFDEDLKELRGHLIRIGATRVKGEGTETLWHLPASTKGSWTDWLRISWASFGTVLIVLTLLVFTLDYFEIGLWGSSPEDLSPIEQILRR
ncbi:hypothetical protein IWQ51_006860 [Labrenzia sp. EL_142]|nr:hypothetical protein [Labrenzia sp. EL_142]